jgi:hypothetical protein
MSKRSISLTSANALMMHQGLTVDY